MIWPTGILPLRLHSMRDFVRNLSIRTKTFAALAVLLFCFAVLGINSYCTMNATRNQLAAVRSDTLPKQTVAMEISDDIIATHMRVFRYVTLASNGVTKKLLDNLRQEVLSELDAEMTRLKIFGDRSHLSGVENQELNLVKTQWNVYVDGVKDLMDVGQTDAPMAAMMLGATDESFQMIASHLRAASEHVIRRTASTVGDIVTEVDLSSRWLAFGGIAGMLISVLIALAFAKSIIKPIQAVTKTMSDVSSGIADVAVGYGNRKDEIGQMVEAICKFRKTTQQYLETIATQNRLFGEALHNMSHGLCMFDANARLIVRNDRYLEIVGMPRGSIEPGCTLREILEKLAVAGVLNADPDKYIADLRATSVRGEYTHTISELNDGRSLYISNRPMAGGGWVATYEDVTDRRRTEERVAHLARHDVLTGLPNRLYFRESTEQALSVVRRGGSLALLCIDLDHFKEVNDTLGHPAGDKLLKKVADRLRENVRETDILARLGGDEFAVVQIAFQRPDELTALASRLVEAISEPYDIDGQEAVVGISIGIAVAPMDGNDPDLLLKNADMALYRAKAEGRGMFRFFEAEMDARLQARRKLETELRKAVAQGEFEVHYQPIIDLKDDQVVAFEALVRWNHPERGLVMPDEFISVAEDIGLIGCIGEWVLREACAQAATWPRDIRVAVNLSPSQFRKTLVPTVIQTLAATGLRPDLLELEITESVLLQNSETTLLILRQLHDIGVRISMDDFGTGYSSLSYLHSFPFDKIKIDRSFVSKLETQPNCMAIVRAVAGLGRTLGMKTTAEGVETVEQLEWLRSEGCSEVQGYLFSRPKPAESLFMLIRQLDKQFAA
jgi:diguanylate cyclase (GGDEF)-like protein